MHVLRIALGIDDELNGYAALEVRGASFSSELRFNGMNHDGPAVAAAAPGAASNAMACTESATQARAESRTSAAALGCEGNLRRLRKPQIGQIGIVRHLDLHGGLGGH